MNNSNLTQQNTWFIRLLAWRYEGTWTKLAHLIVFSEINTEEIRIHWSFLRNRWLSRAWYVLEPTFCSKLLWKANSYETQKSLEVSRTAKSCSKRQKFLYVIWFQVRDWSLLQNPTQSCSTHLAPPMTQSLLISKRTWYNSQDEKVEEDVDYNIYLYFSQNVAYGFSYNATPQLQHNVCERRRWAPNGKLNNLPLGFPFSNHTNFGDFALLFCKGRAELLFCPVCLLYCHVLVGVTIMVCLRFLMRKNRVVDCPCPFKISL